MRNFDVATLVVVDAYVMALLGALLLLSAFQGQREKALMYMAFGALASALGLIVSLLRSQPEWHVLAIAVSNAILILGHAMVWAALRAFSHHPQRTPALLAGSLVWLVLCLWPFFQGSASVRIDVYSLVCSAYLVLALREAWRLRRQTMFGVWPAMTVLGLQILFYAYRAVTEKVPPIQGPDQSGFALTMFESILFAISLSFVILMMVRERAERQYRHAAMHDDLTGLHNRRAFCLQASQVLGNARAHQRDAVLLMCDMDWFKHINDQYGHVAGDQALRMFADVLRRSVRSQDLCARIGGEEFVVLAAGLELAQGLDLADRIRTGLAQQAPSGVGPLSVSIGLAFAGQADYDLDRLLARADEALYGAKAQGRDCALAWASAPQTPPISPRSTVAAPQSP